MIENIVEYESIIFEVPSSVGSAVSIEALRESFNQAVDMIEKMFY